MFHLEFAMSRRPALAETAERIHRVQQLRRLLAELQPPVRAVFRELPAT
jgi:hypothetical protein